MATTELAGTGMDTLNPAPNALAVDDPGYCGANNQVGGGTGWLVTSGNVKGGEIMKLRIAVWDTSDGIYDSVSILDNFQWSVDAAQPGTVIFERCASQAIRVQLHPLQRGGHDSLGATRSSASSPTGTSIPQSNRATMTMCGEGSSR